MAAAPRSASRGSDPSSCRCSSTSGTGLSVATWLLQRDRLFRYCTGLIIRYRWQGFLRRNKSLIVFEKCEQRQRARLPDDENSFQHDSKLRRLCSRVPGGGGGGGAGPSFSESGTTRPTYSLNGLNGRRVRSSRSKYCRLVTSSTPRGFGGNKMFSRSRKNSFIDTSAPRG